MLPVQALNSAECAVVDMATLCQVDCQRFIPKRQLRAPMKAKTLFSIYRPQGKQIYVIFAMICFRYASAANSRKGKENVGI